MELPIDENYQDFEDIQINNLKWFIDNHQQNKKELLANKNEIFYLKERLKFAKEKIEYLESKHNIPAGSFKEVFEYREYLRAKRPVFKFNIN